MCTDRLKEPRGFTLDEEKARGWIILSSNLPHSSVEEHFQTYSGWLQSTGLKAYKEITECGIFQVNTWNCLTIYLKIKVLAWEMATFASLECPSRNG